MGRYINRTLGSLLSLIIADLVMQDLETKAIAMLGFQLPFYFRYVNDDHDGNSVWYDFILTIFNSFPRLQFILEIDGDNNINFLDVTIINNNSCLELDWYYKLTFSERYLNHLSISHKEGVIMSMLDRVMLLSDSIYNTY